MVATRNGQDNEDIMKILLQIWIEKVHYILLNSIYDTVIVKFSIV